MSTTKDILPQSLNHSFYKAKENNERAGKHKDFINFGESLLIYLCGFIVGEYRNSQHEEVKYEKLFFSNNKNLSTGTYLMFLREGVKILKSINYDTAISQKVIGKNQMNDIAKFHIAFSSIKKIINSGESTGFNKTIEEELAKRNQNFPKTNLLEFFNTFIELRNRVAHPHKEVKGLSVTWPSSTEYYEAINIYLENAFSEAVQTLDDLWEFDEYSLLDVEDNEVILENLKTGDQINFDSALPYSKGTRMLLKKENGWICHSLKETMKVGENIIELINKEKEEAQLLKSIDDFKDQIKIVLIQNQQIPPGELNFLRNIAENKLKLEPAEIKEIIFEIAKELEIEDPFPEVDKRFIDAIDNALSSGDYNPFFLKLLGNNFGVQEEEYQSIIDERCEVLGIDLNKISAKTRLAFSKEEFDNLTDILESVKWIESISAIAKRSKGVYNVEKGNHNIYGTKEFFHRDAFTKTESYIKNQLSLVQNKMGDLQPWIVEANNWQQGNLTGYIWIKCYPQVDLFKSELHLGFSLHSNEVQTGLLCDIDKITDLKKNNYGLIRNIFINLFNKRLSEFKSDFIKYTELKIEGVGGTSSLVPVKWIIENAPNYLNHFYNMGHIRFYTPYKKVIKNPKIINEDIEIAYSLFGHLINETIKEYEFKIKSFENPLNKEIDTFTSFLQEAKQFVSQYSDHEINIHDNPRQGEVYLNMNEKIKGYRVVFQTGFSERLNGDIYFYFQLKTMHSKDEDIFDNYRTAVNNFAEKVNLLDDSCIYDGFFSSQQKISENREKVKDGVIDKCKAILENYLTELTECLAFQGIPFVGLTPKNKLLSEHNLIFDKALDQIEKIDSIQNKVHNRRNLIYGKKYYDFFGSSKKHGWHDFAYGFDFKKDEPKLFTQIYLEDNVKGANLLLELNKVLEFGYSTVAEDTELDDSIWQMKTTNDQQLIASSQLNRNHAAKYGKIDLEPKYANWAAKNNDEKQWVGLEFEEPKKITEIKTQGRFNRDQWVTKYYLSWSLDGKKWESNLDLILEANTDRDSHIIRKLEHPLICKSLRIHPVEWHEHISMRFDVKAAPVKSESIRFEKYFPFHINQLQNVDKITKTIKKEIELIRDTCPNSFGF